MAYRDRGGGGRGRGRYRNPPQNLHRNSGHGGIPMDNNGTFGHGGILMNDSHYQEVSQGGNQMNNSRNSGHGGIPTNNLNHRDSREYGRWANRNQGYSNPRQGNYGNQRYMQEDQGGSSSRTFRQQVPALGGDQGYSIPTQGQGGFADFGFLSPEEDERRRRELNGQKEEGTVKDNKEINSVNAKESNLDQESVKQVEK
uniref:Uncharacterized protein n=1 Tax=Panagrolaimus superbus TaxID=310955 RepID=A0A914Z0I3_9BILA